jgi:hypothetical protein
LLDDVREQPAALLRRECSVAGEHLDVRADARQRRPQLVGRVRDELALRPRGLLERAEHRVEAPREATELVLPLHVDPLGQVLRLRDALDRGGQPPYRPERGSRDDEAEHGRPRDAASATRMRNRPMRFSDCSTSVSGRAT